MPPRNRVQIPCSFCGKPIERMPHDLKRQKHHYCNHDCYGLWLSDNLKGSAHPKWTGGPISTKCDFCGKPIDLPSYRIKRGDHHYCSASCRASHTGQLNSGENSSSYARSTAPCDFCGKPITRKPHRIKDAKHVFCNATCRAAYFKEHPIDFDRPRGKDSPNWLGGSIHYYGPSWREAKRAARERDNYTCQLCKKIEEEGKKNFHVHHVRPFREFNYVAKENENHLIANDLSNLVLLCMRCHKIVEWNPSRLTEASLSSR